MSAIIKESHTSDPGRVSVDALSDGHLPSHRPGFGIRPKRPQYLLEPPDGAAAIGSRDWKRTSRCRAHRIFEQDRGRPAPISRIPELRIPTSVKVLNFEAYCLIQKV